MSGHLLTAEQLAERWQVRKSHIYNLTRSGRLPVVELGHYKRYRREAVEEFEQSGGTTSERKAG
jgi:excisionase family DNA binding protein